MQTRKGIDVLHVEDDEGFSELCVEFLERQDGSLSVHTESRPSDALNYLDENDVDCVVSDYEMPEMDGLNFLETLRERGSEIPFILFTGKRSEEIASEAISRGVTDYLQKKPGTQQYELLAKRIRNAVDKHRARQHARKRELRLQKFRRAVESSGHSIYFTDADGVIEYVNPAFEKITGYTAEEAVGENARILQSGEHDDGFYQDLWKTILDGDVWRNEVINERKDGERYVVDQTVASVTDDDGEVTHFVAVNADVTERKEQERELRLQNERLEEFANVVAHDLRNPLNVAKGRLSMLPDDCDNEHLSVTKDQLDRMEKLIQDLLTLAQSGEKVRETESVSLRRLAERCWMAVDAEKASLENDIDWSVLADRTRLQQLLENLFQNSVEHGGGNVAIRIGSLEEGDGFYVEDDGNGIPEEKRDRVFERGYSTAESGTGFGLRIVKQVANAHGWEVDLTESDEGGTRFELTGVSFDDED